MAQCFWVSEGVRARGGCMWGGVCVGVRVFACLRVCVFVYSLPDASPVLSPAANSALFFRVRTYPDRSKAEFREVVEEK